MIVDLTRGDPIWPELSSMAKSSVRSKKDIQRISYYTIWIVTVTSHNFFVFVKAVLLTILSSIHPLRSKFKVPANSLVSCVGSIRAWSSVVLSTRSIWTRKSYKNKTIWSSLVTFKIPRWAKTAIGSSLRIIQAGRKTRWYPRLVTNGRPHIFQECVLM